VTSLIRWRDLDAVWNLTTKLALGERIRFRLSRNADLGPPMTRVVRVASQRAPPRPPFLFDYPLIKIFDEAQSQQRVDNPQVHGYSVC